MPSIAAPTADMIPYSIEFSEQVRSFIQPARYNIVLRLFRVSENLSSGLIAPGKIVDEAKRSEARGQILVIGPDCFSGDGHPGGNTIELKEGDWILMPSYAGGWIEISEYPDEEFRMIADTEILARISDPAKVDRKW
ncbi:MAG: hypothetical protein WAN65_13405 [Candidatus Sulfotelmatobacter sp.]